MPAPEYSIAIENSAKAALRDWFHGFAATVVTHVMQLDAAIGKTTDRMQEVKERSLAQGATAS